jgi:hypothetical protein
MSPEMRKQWNVLDKIFRVHVIVGALAITAAGIIEAWKFFVFVLSR